MRPLALLAIGLITATASARGIDVVHSRVDLASATARKISAPRLVPTPITVATATNRLVASYDRTGRVFIRTSPGHDKLSLAIGKHPTEWMPWSFVQPTVLVFEWREVVAGRPPRDIVRGVDLDTGAEMWRREANGSAGLAIGDRLFVFDVGAGLDLVDSRTGKLVKHLALAGRAVNALAIEGGDTLLDTGVVLARLDNTGRVVWQVDQLGRVSSIAPLAQPTTRFLFVQTERSAALPNSGAWIVLGASHSGRIDAATGKVAWTKPNIATSFLLDGNRMFTAETARTDTVATVRLVVHDITTGGSIGELEVVHYTGFADQVNASVIAVRGDILEVTSEFVVLD